MQAEFFAAGFDNERLFGRAEAETSGNTVVEELDVIVFKLDDFTAVDANQVIMGRAINEVGVVSFLVVAEFYFVQ